MSDVIVDPLPPVLTHSTLNLLAGASGVGKTALIAYMARCFLRGEPLLGHRPNPVPAVGYIGADRKWTNDTELWFRKVGLSPAEIPHYAMVEDRTFSTMRLRDGSPRKAAISVYAQTFAEHVDKLALPRGSVLFVDPIAIYIGANMNDYIKCAMGCIDLQHILLDRELCIIGIDHSSKQKGGSEAYTRLQDRIGGSMAKLGYTSTQMYLAGPEEMEADHHTFLWNPHHARSQTFNMKQDPKTGLFSVIGEDASLAPALTLPAPVASLYDALPAPPATITMSEVLALFRDGHSQPTLYRYVKQLHEAKLLQKQRDGSWRKVIPGGETFEG